LIDFSFMTEEEARQANPSAFNHIVATVKPERMVNRRVSIRKLWWRFGWERPEIRKAMAGLSRYIATTETAKHRVFQFLASTILPDHMVIVVASDDACHLGVLSSRVHVVYALAAGGTLEDRPRYNKTRCFDPFPFPECTEKQKERIRKIAEELDAHRKRAQQQHGLGLTDIYNVLEKLRAVSASNVGPALAAGPSSTRKTGPATSADPTASEPGNSPSTPEPLTPKERAVHEAAMVSTLRQLHDDLDAAVADAYGWPWPMTDAEILEHVVALNTARAAEEKAGVIRWLRPEYQATGELQLEGGSAHPDKPEAKAAKKPGKQSWPATLAERIMAVENALTQAERPATAAELAKQFARARETDMQEILDTLYSLGRARPGDVKGTFVR
jgi:hypothetical protein